MVHLTLPTFIALLAITNLVSSTSDDSPMEYPNGLMKRQSGAFIPSSTHGNGKTCADAFGPGFVSCGKGIQCVNPAQGQTCCSEGYGCPVNSFCLIKGFCCPNGLTPQQCALSHSVTLPPDFTTAGVSNANNATTPTATASGSVTKSTSSVVAVVPTTGGTLSATATATATVTPVVFTGGAVAWRAGAAGDGWGAVVLAGVVGVLGGGL